MYTKFGIISYGPDIVEEYRAKKGEFHPMWTLTVILLLALATIQIG